MSIPAATQGMTKTLISLGIMDMKKDPPRLICHCKTWRNPNNGILVTIAPVPNIASPSYWQRVLCGNHTRYDKIMCEDGRGPVVEGTAQANRSALMQRLFPWYAPVPVVPADQLNKYEFNPARDPAESSMAYHSSMHNLQPPVDPRARRGIERIDSLPPNTRVVYPWNLYHMPYLQHSMIKQNYELVQTEDILVMTQAEIVRLVLTTAIVLGAVGVILFRILFGF